ncbi:hypothetical protein ACQ2H7_004165 [Candidozyma auris]
MDDDDTYRRLLDDCEQQRRVSCLSQDIIDEEREVLRIRRIIPAHESDENIPSIFENAVNQGKIRKHLVLKVNGTLVFQLTYFLNAGSAFYKPKLFGYLGAPIAVAINYWLMAGGLLFATLLLDESSTLSGIHPLRCWTGLHLGRAFSDWGKLLKLAIPGWTMLEAEFLAFEILTLMSSYLGTIELAAQSVGSTMASLTYQVPFAMGIAASTRIANYLGAGLSECAKATSEVSLGFGFCVSLVNFLALYSMQGPIATLFTTDEKVIAKLHEIMWLVALMQISDAMNANSAGCLRGQGLTKIGGIVNLVSYYVVGIPLSIYLSFYSPWRGSLHGLWIGTTVALTLIGVIQTYVVLSADSEQLCKDARDRTSESV